MREPRIKLGELQADYDNAVAKDAAAKEQLAKAEDTATRARDRLANAKATLEGAFKTVLR